MPNPPASRLDNQAREKMRHLRCLCFVRPSPDSIQFLVDELREPKYGEYIICRSSRPVAYLRAGRLTRCRLQQRGAQVIARAARRGGRS